MKYRYLVIEFHDNDFGQDFTDALKKFYADCKGNDLFKDNKFDPSERLEEISRAGLLHPILHNYVVGFCIVNRPEHATRFFDLEDWQTFVKPDGFGIKIDFEHYRKYLSEFEIKFYKDKKEFNKWQNGEHFALSLYDGYVWSY